MAERWEMGIILWRKNGSYRGSRAFLFAVSQPPLFGDSRTFTDLTWNG